MKFIDLTGQKFGRLIVIERVENDKWRNTQWLCQCNCGKKKNILGKSLKNGGTKSCGCLQKKRVKQAKYIHGHSSNGINSNTYRVWQAMIQRCTNPNNQAYKNYGGRGIKVYERWRKFEGFLQDMGERPLNLTLDRIDNDGDYCKENCKWSTNKEQHRNKRTNISITINGITKCLTEWCEIYKLNYDTVYIRIRRGWTTEEALELIPRKKKNSD